MRTGVYRTRTGGSRSGKIRRDRGSDDRATQVRQRDPVLPVGTTPSSAGDSLAGGDAMGGCRRGGRVTQTGARRVDPAGGTGRGGTQRRRQHASVTARARTVGRTYGRVTSGIVSTGQGW